MSARKQGLIYLRSQRSTKDISFQVKRGTISTERNFKINEQEMYSNDSKHHTTQYYHNGDDGLSFSCTGIFTKNEKSKMKLLDAWYTHMTPFSIVFGKHLNINLPLVSKKWIITKISMKQEADTVTEWDITFRTYNPPKQIRKVNNTLVNRTTVSYKWNSKCKKSYKNLTYAKMKKKKGNDCAKLLNTILISLGYMKKSTKKDKNGKTVKYVPNICTKSTSKAVKMYKRDWNKYKLKPAFKRTRNGYNDTIDSIGFKNIGNYKQLKNAKKKK